MNPGVEIVGWLATCVAALLAVPQIVRLVRTRSTDGLSLLLWQAMLAINLGWLSHGLLLGAANMVVTNLLGLASTLTILVLLIRARRLRAWRVMLPAVLGGVVIIAVDLLLGPAAFGVAALIPALVSNAGQGVKLVRSPRITGVSPVFLAGQVVNQVLWFTWALMVEDQGTMIAAPVSGAVQLLNLIWWVLRRTGLRPLFVRPVPVEVAPRSSQVSCEP